MCTAISLKTKDRYFARNLDLDISYGEEVCVMPRAFPLVFRQAGEMPHHYAMMGMATVADGLPLYYDAVNEHGLAMAGLYFPGNAYYPSPREGKENIAPFELIPWVLGQCRALEEAKTVLSQLHLADLAYSDAYPTAPLHWMLSDHTGDMVAEFMKDGLHLYDNAAGVLTNNPPFDRQMDNLRQYHYLRRDNALVARESDLPYETYSQGLGAVGLPGDVSSMSRFVRAAFGRAYTVCDAAELSSVGQVFHLLSSVAFVRGCCKTDSGRWDITVYSACMNLSRGLYYYTTYGNRRITCVDMHATPLDGREVSRYPINMREDVYHRTRAEV